MTESDLDPAALDVRDFDAADYLGRESSQIYLLRDAAASGNANYLATAIGVVARARGLSQLARETGIKRQTLNKSLGPQGNPTLETLMAVLPALGLEIDFRFKEPQQRELLEA
ncbi:MAG: addiction module antidote protein [Allosphingosinicella sp.]|uniref:addiction module antidote protein n=1 Tax=Allosphingosinicella sp. TaxID=2823234 RepID=UPI0039464411